MKSFIAALAVALLTACGGGETTVVETPRNPVVVQLYGDSVTDGAAPFLKDYLATGSTVENHALWGQRAASAVSGRYGHLPQNRDPSHYFTFSWGVNECLNGEGAEDLRVNLEYTVVYMKGYRTVLEAPWHVLYGGPFNCTANIDNYRLVVQDLYKKYASAPGYNLTMAVIDNHAGTIGDGIHINEEHSRHRMQLLAEAIYKLR